MKIQNLPREIALDNTLGVLEEGYTFIHDRCRRFASDLFETRLLFRPVTCMMGEDAAVLFYDPEKFTRQGARSPRLLRLLQNKASVTEMDDQEHHHRKELFLSLMTPEQIGVFLNHLTIEWRKQIHKWVHMKEVKLLEELHELLARAACRWAGIPIVDKEACLRGREMMDLVDSSGSLFGPRKIKGHYRLQSMEKWAQKIISDVREGKLRPLSHEAVAKIAWHRNLKGDLLSEEAAAAELINILKPTVSVARWLEFAFHALHKNPGSREKLEHDPKYFPYFIHEVRRYYPLIPFLPGRVRKNFYWRGVSFPEGRLVLFDLYGTNHDERTWKHPFTFEPERFRSWNGSAYNFVSQGAGSFREGHRCPGEVLTIEIMKRSLEIIIGEIKYQVPKQKLAIDLSRIPAQANMLISSVKLNQKVQVPNPSEIRL